MMNTERASNNRRHPLEELSPALRRAVQCVLDHSQPEDLTLRALEAVRPRVSQCPRKPRFRIFSWTGLAIVASIVLMVLAVCDRVAQTVDGRPSKVAMLPTVGEESAAAFADDLPTLWTYSQVVRSPEALEALDALLDHQAHPSASPSSRLLAKTNDSPFAFLHAVTFL
jgi:hypothetical protein